MINVSHRCSKRHPGRCHLFHLLHFNSALAKLEPMAAAMFLIQMIGVAPVPGSGFYGEGDDGAEYIRFTFCRSAPATLSA